jgi:aryl-alcohol dehydrogenase-like predicted oxidoreductase
LGFGCALWREDKSHWTPERAKQVWGAALDSGINFFDTSYDYVYSEEWIGHILKERYDEFILATKCGCTDSWPTMNASEHSWNRDNLMWGIEGSLRRLNREKVDVLQLHNATANDCENGKLVETLEEIRSQGMTDWIGASTTLPDLPKLLEWGVFDVMQIPYSLLQREHEDLIAKASDAGIGIIIRGGIAQGEVGEGRGTQETWDKFVRAGIDEFLEEGESRSSFVLRYTLSNPKVDTVIVGTTRSEHLSENIKAVARGDLQGEVYEEVKRRMDAIGEASY